MTLSPARAVSLFVLGAVCVALAACRDDGGSAAPATSTASSPATSAPAGTVAARLDAGIHDEILRTPDGRDRTYRVYVPNSATSGTPAPLVVALHGGTGWGTQFEQSSGLDRLADERGFVAVYPDGIGGPVLPERTRTWNAGLCCGAAVQQGVDDVGFVRALLDEVAARHPIDPARVHVIGHSNGAMLGYRLLCELADRIASVGVQAGNLGLSSCRPAAPVGLLHLHGTADTNVPIAGGVGTGVAGVSYPPVAAGLAVVVAADGCSPTPTRSVDPANPDVVTTLWSGGRGGTEVRYVEVTGATHAWMGRPTAVSNLVGVPYPKLDATTVLVDFVLAHPRR